MKLKIINPEHKFFDSIGTLSFVEIEIDGVLVTNLHPDDVQILSMEQMGKEYQVLKLVDDKAYYSKKPDLTT